MLCSNEDGARYVCRDAAGPYPMPEGDRTWLLAADFDEASWREDVSAFRETLGLTPAVERSRSGNGAHVWFFFSQPVPAAARKLGSGLLTQAMDRRHDRLFPSQDTVRKGGFGSLLALPFQGQARSLPISLCSLAISPPDVPMLRC